MKALIACLISVLLWGCSEDNALQLYSPDKNMRVTVSLDEQGTPFYSVTYHGETVINDSRLGITLNDSDFSGQLSATDLSPVNVIEENYELWTGKKSHISYSANEQTLTLTNAQAREMTVTFRLSDDGVAFRYGFPGASTDVKRVTAEATTFALPEKSHAWMQPIAVAQTGWMNTNPSYEEHYQMNIPVGTPSPSEAGWVFPALFNTGNHWLLISEAGMDGSFHGSRLQQNAPAGEYKIGSPMAPEVFTGGALMGESTLPFASPWRIIVVGSLATVMESTLGTDLAEPIAIAETDFIKPGIASWSWGLLKDDATVYDVQKRFIDYAAVMHWPYTLIDADWDRKIGYEKIKELADYAATKNVGLLLWYNSSGAWNKTEYSPKGALLTHTQREQEFARIAAMGIKGIKIDFFAGDGQSMVQYYMDILKDAAKHQLLVNFHGTTLPRGLQRTYPNLMTAEAVKGFEMITFTQENADLEASHAAMLPFARNAFDPMDFTPTVFDKIPNIQRKTTNGFQLALPVVFLSGIQHIVETPDGMATVPDFVKQFMQNIPSRWDDTKFVAGYPGKLTVIARRAGNTWYVAGINGEDKTKNLTLDLSFIAGKTGSYIADGKQPLSFAKSTIVASQQVPVNLQGNGGFVMVFK